MATRQLQLQDAIEISDDETASSSGDNRSACSSTRKRKATDEVDVWADTPDNEWQIFQESKKRKRPKVKTSSKATKGRSKGNASVRRNGRVSLQGFQNSGNGETQEENGDPSADLVPAHILERRRQFEKNRATLGTAGVKLPPQFDDICFSDDEKDPAELKERPIFDHIEPCRPYKDIPLELSAGLIPASIAQYLRDYQVEGVKFLHQRFVYQKGAILGDDMGLGKTVQVAAFLTAAFGKTGDERDSKRLRKIRRHPKRWYPVVLIVCPGTLIENWKCELKRWGWWKIDVFHGTSKDDALKAARNGTLEIMITTYGTYKKNEEKINLVDWDAVIADECHHIKERQSDVTKAMDRINTLCRIGLTGTAIQNKYDELWVLLNWTNPGHFGTLGEWNISIVKPLTRGQSHDATWSQLSLARKTAKKLVHNLLPDFFLRRMKSLIADQLPKKSDRVVFCPLTGLQKEAYKNMLNGEEVETIIRRTEPCDCGSGRKRGWCCHIYLPDGRSWTALVFPVIQALKKLSNHLTLLIPSDGESNQEKRESQRKTLRTSLPHLADYLYSHRNSIHVLSDAEYCGKWKILKKLLSFWYENKDKVLVFSHSVRLLNILNSLFKSTSYSVSFLSGALSYEDRQKEVDNFNSDPNKFVFLISTKAGGVGLNITSANKVVIFDPDWNPSYDLQAQDRAYRIGQVRDVEVFRLVSAGTIEEIVYARQIYKQQQANIGYNASSERRYFKGVQKDKDRNGELFGLKNLFSFHADHVVLKDIMNKTNVAEAKVNVTMLDIDMEKAADDEDDEFKHIKREDTCDEDGGVSQLAALIKTENTDDLFVKKTSEKPKSAAVQAILASVGVEYTHENSEVIGSSKVEAQLSRRAELVDDADVNDANGDSTLFAAGHADETLFADDSETHDPKDSVFTPRFKPPQDVMLRQFCSMAKEFRFDNVTEFALVVEQMTQDQRRHALDGFYRTRMAKLVEELEKREVADGKISEIPKAEAGAPEEPHFKADLKTDVKAKADLDYDSTPLHPVNADDPVKNEGRGEVMKQYVDAKEESTTSITAQQTSVWPKSLFIYDDGDDDDEL